MTAIDGYGALALLVLGLVFWFIRTIPAYLIAGGLIVIAFAALTFNSLTWAEASNWLVMTSGLALSVFGLLIVRVMLIRSVSLNLLGSMHGERKESFGEDIGARLGDMRKFGLIETSGNANSLTGFGRFVAGVIALFYAVFRIKT
ncbi:MAG TPA: hypothetical protein VFU02_00215 [Polyangiaceae bacterium]|nr:hypothetical protein [Polyangiaceae bacterium]